MKGAKKKGHANTPNSTHTREHSLRRCNRTDEPATALAPRERLFQRVIADLNLKDVIAVRVEQRLHRQLGKEVDVAPCCPNLLFIRQEHLS
jgi:hypothetical protein